MANVKEMVCVTGAGGFLGSWLVKLLLSKGYIVHATVREPNDEKNVHLKTLENASKNLLLFKADLMDYDSLFAAIKGCSGVFHLANPNLTDDVPNPEERLLFFFSLILFTILFTRIMSYIGSIVKYLLQVEVFETCVTGMSNVLKACSAANVKRAVVTSSIAAITCNRNWPAGKPMDESCWSDEETINSHKLQIWRSYNWYDLAKTKAETRALEYGKKTGLDVLTVCPSFMFGPMLQQTMNLSSSLMYALLKYGMEIMAEKPIMVVDVRDAAEAFVLLYEKPEAEGRYICASHRTTIKDLSDKMKVMYPNYNHPKLFYELDDDENLTSQKLQKLGWRYRPIEESIVDSVQSFREKGLLE